MRTIILGSGSPRRKELLAPHFRLKIFKPDIDETPYLREKPIRYVRRMAKEKWQKTNEKFPSEICLAADTVVILGTKILGKPSSRADAKKMLRSMSGKSHQVVTAVCLGSNKKTHLWHSSTKIQFRSLTSIEIENYLKTREWQGKAGAYAIQGLAAHFVAKIQGSLTNVIGLPLEDILRGQGT